DVGGGDDDAGPDGGDDRAGARGGGGRRSAPARPGGDGAGIVHAVLVDRGAGAGGGAAAHGSGAAAPVDPGVGPARDRTPGACDVYGAGRAVHAGPPDAGSVPGGAGTSDAIVDDAGGDHGALRGGAGGEPGRPAPAGGVDLGEPVGAGAGRLRRGQ